ncbi:MAG: CBS domain-containing protein [Verrucomicrobia bacterium]|nr:CBS domain-containing protein [Verrucomicrobiota bacterium]
MKISDILTKDPQVTSPDATICEAARKMKEHDIGMLPVCDGERLVGSLTDRDLAIRAIAEGCDPFNTKVRDVMTPKVYYCFEDSDVEDAAVIMENEQVRRLPVLNSQKRLIGIISIGDLAVRSGDEQLLEEVMERVCEPTGQ